MAWFFSQWIFGNADQSHYWLNDGLLQRIREDPSVGQVLNTIIEEQQVLLTKSTAEEGEWDTLVRKVSDLTVSPLLASDEILSLLPNVTIYVSEHDVLRDEGYAMYKRILDAKGGGGSSLVEWEGAIHVEFSDHIISSRRRSGPNL